MNPTALQLLLVVCAPNVAPVTLEALIRAESGGNVLALHVNGPVRPSRAPCTVQEAAGLAKQAIRAGYSVDLGLLQVNSKNLAALGYTIEQMFDPCANLAAGAAILTDAYRDAARVHGPGQKALRAALSVYNTGSRVRGLRNGYVERVAAKTTRKAAWRSPNRCDAETMLTAK